MTCPEGHAKSPKSLDKVWLWQAGKEQNRERKNLWASAFIKGHGWGRLVSQEALFLIQMSYK